MDSIYFLILGGVGGGWDGIVCGIGEVLIGVGLVGSVLYENMLGGGGGVVIGYLIENVESNYGILMVNLILIVICLLIGVFLYNFCDLILVLGIIGDYVVIVVNVDSDIGLMDDLLVVYKVDMCGIVIGGGLVFGGMDYFVVVMVM